MPRHRPDFFLSPEWKAAKDAAIKQIGLNHEARMKSDPEYRALQERRAAEYAEAFGSPEQATDAIVIEAKELIK